MSSLIYVREHMKEAHNATLYRSPTVTFFIIFCAPFLKIMSGPLNGRQRWLTNASLTLFCSHRIHGDLVNTEFTLLLNHKKTSFCKRFFALYILQTFMKLVFYVLTLFCVRPYVSFGSTRVHVTPIFLCKDFLRKLLFFLTSR